MAKWVEVAGVSELPAGAKLCRLAEGTPIVVCHVKEGLRAFLNMCPHAGLPLGEGSLDGTVITCPFHGYAYDVDNGKNVDFDGDIPLRMFPVRVQAGKIEVELPG